MLTNPIKTHLNDRLFDDLLWRSNTAAVHFILGAFLFMHWVLDERLKFIHNIFLTGIIAASLTRWIVATIYSRFKHKLNRNAVKLVIGICIYFNAAFWGLTLGLTFWLNPNYSIPHTKAFVFVSFLTSASIVTLSSFLPYAFFFQLSLFLPLLIFSIRDVYIFEIEAVTPIMIAQTFALIYLFVQSIHYNKHLKEKYLNEIMLLELNQELRKSKEDLISETLKVQHTSRLASLGEMAGGIAHEINNPMSVILGALQSIKLQFSKEKIDAEIIKKMILKSENSIHRVSKIISGLKKFSIQEPKNSFEKFDLTATIDETLGFCAEKFKAHFINLEIHNIPNATIEGSSIQLSQVLLNLMNNAFDAVWKLSNLEEKTVVLKIEREANNVIISICNSGPKIPIEIQNRIFEPFFTTKEVGKGTGLGLSISKGLIENHNGKIWLDSEAIQTTFKISLPCL